MKEYELLIGNATGKIKPFFFFSAISSRKKLGIDNTKLTSPNKPLGKADGTFSLFFFNTQTNLKFQLESMCFSLQVFTNPKQNYVVFDFCKTRFESWL